MKKLLIGPIFFSTLLSCKKDTAGSRTTDLFKNTDWTGEYLYNGQKYLYSMAFNSNDSTMIFYDYFGGIAAKYHANVSAKKVSITVANNKLVGEFGFSDDGKFTTFTINPASAFQLLNGELNKSSVNLVQTIWTGKTYNDNWGFDLRFVSESQVFLTFIPGGADVAVNYTIKAHTLQFVNADAGYFGIIRDSVINGDVYNHYLTPSMQNWSVRKQL